jgi:hypothetical protein
MKPFKSTDGRMIYPRTHLARFEGKRNSCKSKTLLVLYNEPEKYLTAKQLHQLTGVSLAYLEVRLTFWYNIRYVNRKPTAPAHGRPVWGYLIAERGRHFVDDRIPREKRMTYLIEIKQWQSKTANE